ncbi:MAG: replication-relaxation family protein [Caldilineaceae bacterium]
MIARFGHVSTPQIAKRYFKGNSKNSQMASNLKKLEEAGYIHRFSLPSSSSTARNMPLVATLTKKGAELISNSQSIDIGKLHVLSPSDQPKAAYFEHLMDINEVRVTLELACEQQQCVLKWLDERTIRKHKLYDYVIVRGKQGKEEKTANIPDGFLTIKGKKGYLSFFLEVDRGTEPIAVIQQKAFVYVEYEKSTHYAKYFGAAGKTGGAASLFVLLITSSAKRRENIVATLKHAFTSQPLLCAAYPELTPQTVLTEPVWYAPHLSDPIDLLSNQ